MIRSPLANWRSPRLGSGRDVHVVAQLATRAKSPVRRAAEFGTSSLVWVRMIRVSPGLLLPVAVPTPSISCCALLPASRRHAPCPVRYRRGIRLVRLVARCCCCRWPCCQPLHADADLTDFDAAVAFMDRTEGGPGGTGCPGAARGSPRGSRTIRACIGGSGRGRAQLARADHPFACLSMISTSRDVRAGKFAALAPLVFVI